MSDAAESPESPECLGRAVRAARLCPVISVFVVVALLGDPSRAAAQQPGPRPVDSISPAEAEFLPRTTFQMAANTLSGDDPRFTWDARWGGSADVLDYHFGRLGIVGDYEAVVGSERKNFDIEQGIYILEASTSGFFQGHELALVFHHVSRHLTDREKLKRTAWNVLEARYLHNFDLSGTKVALIAAAGNTVTHADVDYTWNLNADVTVRHAIGPRWGLYARGLGEAFGVDPTIRGRTDAQHSGRFEGGVRLDARGGVLELFGGVEHRLDADLRDYLPATWGIMGFRLTSK
jgi:hypothetical protein